MSFNKVFNKELTEKIDKARMELAIHIVKHNTCQGIEHDCVVCFQETECAECSVAIKQSREFFFKSRRDMAVKYLCEHCTNEELLELFI